MLMVLPEINPSWLSSELALMMVLPLLETNPAVIVEFPGLVFLLEIEAALMVRLLLAIIREVGPSLVIEFAVMVRSWFDWIVPWLVNF